MDAYKRMAFIDNGQKWEIEILAHMVLQWGCLGDIHLFYFLFPSYQITCVDFVSPFGDKSLEKKPWYVSMSSTHPL
jgi:hypothetical protein